ncbi:MAG: hypothetical protein ACLUOI_21850 [Eisenbergiella sp.]
MEGKLVKWHITRKNVHYPRADIAGIYYHKTGTYYRNMDGLSGKVILMYPVPVGQEQRRM